MNITLYKAADELRTLLEQINEETGELPEGYEEARALVASKAKACAAFVVQTEAQANLLEEHAKNLLQRAEVARKKTKWLRQYLAEHMKAAGIFEIKSDDGLEARLEIERDTSVEVFDEGKLPMDYTREIPAKYLPDKRLIKKSIENGLEVPGAKIIKKDRFSIL